MLNDTIKETKPWVKFGISPFGVWRNKSDDPRGSDTRAGATNYDHLYADVIKWQEKGWIDYLLPQIYWQVGHPQADFKMLANWFAVFLNWKDQPFTVPNILAAIYLACRIVCKTTCFVNLPLFRQ